MSELPIKLWFGDSYVVLEVEYLWNSWKKKNEVYSIDAAFSPRLNFNKNNNPHSIEA